MMTLNEQIQAIADGTYDMKTAMGMNYSVNFFGTDNNRYTAELWCQRHPRIRYCCETIAPNEHVFHFEERGHEDDFVNQFHHHCQGDDDHEDDA